MRKSAVLIMCAAFIWGCTSFSRSYRLGTQETLNKNWDEAIKHYEKAMLDDPANPYYRLALIRAKIAASNFHLNQARQLVYAEKMEEAFREYDKALSYDPDNRLILNEIRSLTKRSEQEEPVKPMESLYEPPLKLKVSDQPITLRFPREVSLKSIFQALAKYAEVNLIFDESFRDKPFSIDLADMSFEQALERLCMVSKHFYRVVDASTALIIVDNPQNHMKYDLTAIKTFYLSNILAQDVQQALLQMVRSQQMIPTISHNKDLNSVTVKTTPDKLKLAEQMIRQWDKPKGEIVVELEIMQVSRQMLRDMGMELDAYNVGIGYVGGVSTGDGTDTGDGTGTGAVTPTQTSGINLGDLDFTKKENYSISLPSAFIRFLETDADTKLIAQPQLRGVHGEKIEYMVGDEVPIPNTTFQPFAGGGIAQQPIVNYDYKNVGIEIYITPTIHSADEVSLEVDLKIKALAGSGFGDLPVISSRQIKNIMRLRDGETNLLAGLLKEEERLTLKGIPGIREIPVLGTLFSYSEQEVQQTDVIMTITPYIIRSIPLDESDQTPLWLPLEGVSGEGAGGGRLPRTRFVPGMERDEIMDVRQEEAAEDEASNRVKLSPPGFETAVGREVRVNVSMFAQDEIQNMTLTFSFNSQVLELKSVIRGSVLARIGGDPAFLENIDNSSGTCVVGFTSPQLTSGFQGSGNIVTLVFAALDSGESQVTVSSISANSVEGGPVQFDASVSNIRIR